MLEQLEEHRPEMPMRQIANMLIAMALILFSQSATAQMIPDFSGRWTSEVEAPTPATRTGGQPAAQGSGQRGRGRGGDMGSGWGTNITVVQDANRLTVEYAFFARSDMQPPLKFTYALDGSETNNSVMMGRGT